MDSLVYRSKPEPHPTKLPFNSIEWIPHATSLQGAQRVHLSIPLNGFAVVLIVLAQTLLAAFNSIEWIRLLIMYSRVQFERLRRAFNSIEWIQT